MVHHDYNEDNMNQDQTKKRVETVELPPRRFQVEGGLKPIVVGSGQPLALISGPCVIDSRELVFEAARRLVDITQRVGIPLIFKSSYEKDNRGSEKNWR